MKRKRLDLLISGTEQNRTLTIEQTYRRLIYDLYLGRRRLGELGELTVPIGIFLRAAVMVKGRTLSVLQQGESRAGCRLRQSTVSCVVGGRAEV